MSKRICFIGWITFPFGSASGSRVRTLATGLTEKGYSVHVLTTHRIAARREYTQEDGIFAYNGITYESTNVYEIAGKQRSLFTRVQNHLGAIVKSWVRFARVAREEELGAVYIYGRSFLGYAPICLLARLHGIAIIFDICEWFPASHFWGRFFHFRFLKNLFGRQLPRFCGGKVVAITSLIKSRYDAWGVPCLLIPSVYDFSNRGTTQYARHVTASDVFTLVYAGTCKASDGVDTLFEAVSIAVRNGCPVRLEVIGCDGRSGASVKYGVLRERSETLKAHVFFRGRLSEEDYSASLVLADCLVLPRPDTQVNRASFPTRLPEFLATGRPVLISDTPDVPLYIKGGRHAEVVSARGGAGALASGILRLWRNEERARELGLNGQNRCKEVFHYRAHVSSLIDFIDQQNRTN